MPYSLVKILNDRIIQWPCKNVIVKQLGHDFFWIYTCKYSYVFHTHSTLNTLYSCIDYWIDINAILLLCVMFFSRINQKSHRLYSFVWLLRCFDLWFNTKWHQCWEWQTVLCVCFLNFMSTKGLFFFENEGSEMQIKAQKCFNT